ncbi:hypothetical protein [Listeria innocua]|uniref:hypothetical protein n=1 Tax=Listeria innocua TaxID=1642 RepID=UPI001625C0AA|nr:hypothetical protein [Listeria innocua]MBC1925559.1 hypothetical protein [Listeria innocua]
MARECVKQRNEFSYRPNPVAQLALARLTENGKSKNQVLNEVLVRFVHLEQINLELEEKLKTLDTSYRASLLPILRAIEKNTDVLLELENSRLAGGDNVDFYSRQEELQLAVKKASEHVQTIHHEQMRNLQRGKI